MTVFVGPKRKKFYLHRELICERSPFMEKCFKKNRFGEGDKNELHLPEDDVKAFSIIVDWIYRNRLPSRNDPQYDLSDMSAAYCMADKFGMEELVNDVMDSIRSNVARHEGDPCKRALFSAMALTQLTGPAKSPLKRFYVEHLVFQMMKNPKSFHDLKRNEPARTGVEELFKLPELGFYIMKKTWQFQIEGWSDPAKWDKCCYHSHSTTMCQPRAGVAPKPSKHHQIASSNSSLSGALSHGSTHQLRNSANVWPSTSMGIWNNPVRW